MGAVPVVVWANSERFARSRPDTWYSNRTIFTICILQYDTTTYSIAPYTFCGGNHTEPRLQSSRTNQRVLRERGATRSLGPWKTCPLSLLTYAKYVAAPRTTLTKEAKAAHLNSEGRAMIIVKTNYYVVSIVLQLTDTNSVLSLP